MSIDNPVFFLENIYAGQFFHHENKDNVFNTINLHVQHLHLTSHAIYLTSKQKFLIHKTIGNQKYTESTSSFVVLKEIKNHVFFKKKL